MAIQTNPSYTRKKQRIQKIMFACFRMLSYGVALLLFPWFYSGERYWSD